MTLSAAWLLSERYSMNSIIDDAKLEVRGLWRTFMPHEENNNTRKAVTLILVLTWSILTIAMAFEDLATVSPPFYGLYTAVIFLIVGRLWNLEVEKLLPK